MIEKFDYNFLQNNGFLFSLERLPQTMFRVVACDVPSISVPPPQAGTQGATQYFPGGFTEFEDLTMDFLVDEDLKNYEEIYHWITQQRYFIRDGYKPKGNNDELMVSDGTLVTMLNSSYPNRVFSFKNMFPITIGNLHFDTSVTEPTPVSCQVTFKYSYFVLEPKKTNQ